jgi:4-amino-4-deoxy-L-arabinose transferase-like glycosyltransferase
MNDPEKIHSMPPRPPGRRDFCVACAVIGTAFAVLTMLTWRKWPDLLVDFGLQLYCPWKLSTGSVLYRDMAYLTGGPLSQYYHALLFKIFGVSFLTLIISNLAITAVLLLVIYRCFYGASNQLTAITACLAIVTAFAFVQLNPFGIFNYITPYCSEIVHGLVLSVFAVALLAKWFREEKLRLAAAAGFFCGLTFLTKPEVFLALGISVSGGLLLFWRVRKKPGFLLRSLGAMVAAALLPVSAFFIYFWRMTDFHGACDAVCGGWIPVLTTHTADNRYFRWCMGLDAPAAHLRRMFIQSFGMAIIAGVAALLCRRRAPGWLSRSLLVFAAAGLAALSLIFNWRDCGQCLPVVCVALLALQLWRVKVSGLEPGAVFPILWTVFSLGMLIKLGLFSRIWHYGFVLGMPAFLCAIYLLLWLLPRELERFNVNPVFLRGLLWVPLMIGCGELTMFSLNVYSWKTVPVGAGADKMWAFHRRARLMDTGVIMALHWMETNTPPQATLAVLPTGMMVNYLPRRTNPSRYPIWPPPEIAAFGQEKMTDDFILNSPDYIIVIGMDFGEFGEKYFGMEKRFGGDLMKWVNARYEQKYLIGNDWLQTGRPGIKIFQKTAR